MKFNSIDFSTYFDEYPNEYGFFGKYGGAYIDEELREAITEVQVAYLKHSSILINLSGSGDKDIDHILSST